MPHSVTNEIAPTPTRDRTPLTYADKQIVADVLTWDCQRSVSAEEIETIAIMHDILWVKLTDHRAVPIAVSTFRNIRSQQLEHQPQPEADVTFVMEMEAKLEADAIEVDQADGAYRVWRGTTLMGKFHHCPNSSHWVAEFAHLSFPSRYESAGSAQQAVVETYDWFATPVGRFKW